MLSVFQAVISNQTTCGCIFLEMLKSLKKSSVFEKWNASRKINTASCVVVWYIPESSNRSAPFYHNALILQTMMRKSMFAMLSASVRVLSAWKDLKRGAHQIHYGILEELQGMRWLQGTTRNWTRLSPITHGLGTPSNSTCHRPNGDKGRQGETWEPMTRNDSRWLKINVVSWLVARFAIMPKMFQIIQGPSNVWKVHYCGKNFWHTCFFLNKIKMIEWNKNWHFFWKKSCLSAFPNESERLFISPYSRTVFPQIPKALGHERVQFTLVGLFSGFRIAASFFPELILEPREER